VEHGVHARGTLPGTNRFKSCLKCPEARIVYKSPSSQEKSASPPLPSSPPLHLSHQLDHCQLANRSFPFNSSLNSAFFNPGLGRPSHYSSIWVVVESRFFKISSMTSRTPSLKDSQTRKPNSTMTRTYDLICKGFVMLVLAVAVPSIC
jgi:hypothetical protein